MKTCMFIATDDHALALSFGYHERLGVVGAHHRSFFIIDQTLHPLCVRWLSCGRNTGQDHWRVR
jgi:hypothetical protein